MISFFKYTCPQMLGIRQIKKKINMSELVLRFVKFFKFSNLYQICRHYSFDILFSGYLILPLLMDLSLGDSHHHWFTLHWSWNLMFPWNWLYHSSYASSRIFSQCLWNFKVFGRFLKRIILTGQLYWIILADWTYTAQKI